MRRVLHLFLRLLPRLVGPLLVLVPLGFLSIQGFYGLLRRADALLAQMTPVAAAVLSEYLERPVTIGKLAPNLTTVRLFDMVMHPATYGTFPVQISDITIRNRANEVTLAGSEILAQAREVTLYLSLPEAVLGKTGTMLPRVVVTHPEATIVRNRKGELNLTQILPKKPGKPGQPVFRTVVEIDDALLHFRDFDKSLPATIYPAVNDVRLPQGIVDLSGSRFMEIQLPRIRAVPGSLTASRLRGTLSVNATVRREDPGTGPLAPLPGTPLLTVRLNATNADAGYWVPYFVTNSAFEISRGLADARVTLILPETTRSPEVTVDSRFAGATAKLKFLSFPLTDASGTLQFADGALQFSATTTALGESVQAVGALWNLAVSSPGAASHPEFQIAINAPRMGVRKAVQALLPARQNLPRELTVGGIASVQATISGKASGDLSDLTIVGRVAGVDAAWKGLPGLRDVSSDLTLAGGVLQLKHLAAQIMGNGRLTGDGTVRVLGSPGQIGNGVFGILAQDVDLARLSLLANLNRTGTATRLKGFGSIAAAGRRFNGKLTAAANIQTRNLMVGQVPIPIARARVLFDDNRIAVTMAQIESPAGIATVSGDVLSGSRLGLRFSAVSLDLKTFSSIFGIRGIAGTVSATGTVTGSIREPQVHLADLSAMNLRWRLPPQKKDGLTINAALDLVRASQVEISSQRVRLNRPMAIYRFPAAVTLTGEVTQLLPNGPKAPFDPKINLLAQVRHLGYEEIEQQLGLGKAKSDVSGEAKAPAVSGSIISATVRVGGRLTDPQVTGNATLSTVLIGEYPLTGGDIAFSYTKRETGIQRAEVRTSFGAIAANVTIAASGKIAGTFRVPTIDLSRLSYLTNGIAAFTGTATVSGTLGGTLERPEVSASIAAPSLTVADTTYLDLSAQNIRFVGGAKGRGGTVSLPVFRFRRQKGEEPSPDDTQVAITNARYELTTGEVGAELLIQNADASTLIETIRRSNIDETPTGAKIVRALNSLPSPPVDKATNKLLPLLIFDLKGAVRGRLVAGKFENPEVDADLKAHDLNFGAVKADRLTLTGTLRNKIVDISEFEVVSTNATIRGYGKYDPDGEVNASIESNDASLDIVRLFPGMDDFPIRGSVDFSLSATGPSKNPKITSSLLGRDLFVVTSTDPNLKDSHFGVIRSVGDKQEAGLPVSLFRLEADLVQSNPNDYNIVVSDLLLKANDNLAVSGDAVIPVNVPGEQSSLAQRPLRFNFRTGNERDANQNFVAKPIELTRISDYLQGKDTPEAPPPTAEARPKSGFAALIDRLTPKIFRPKARKEIPLSDVGGTLTANISFGGSLDKPTLSGAVVIDKGRLRLVDGNGAEHINPIRNFEGILRLDGSNIVFDRFLVQLGGLRGQSGDFGSMDISGKVILRTLADLEKVLRGQALPAVTDDESATRQAGTYDLAVHFDGLRPVEDNYLGLGEGVKGKIDGTLRVVGGLKSPTIKTVDGSPLVIRQAELRAPSKQAKKTAKSDKVTFNPRFAISLSLPETSTITNSASTTNLQSEIASLTQLLLFQFDVKATKPISISGHLFPRTGAGNDPNYTLKVDAAFAPQGGRIRTPLARFAVQRQGTVLLSFGGNTPRLEVRDVRATSTIPVRRGASVSGSSTRDVLTSNSDATSSVNNYDITMTLNAQVSLEDEDSAMLDKNNTTKFTMNFTSDPYLSEADIERLVLPQNLVDKLQQGQGDSALKDLASQAAYGAYLPDWANQLTDRLGQSLGLSTLSVNLNPDGSLGLSTGVRLNRPFDRFTIDYKRTFQQRLQPGQVPPFILGLNYELYEFRAKRNILPRLQLRMQTDQDHNTTYLLNGRVNY